MSIDTSKIIEDNKRGANDTGSPEVQVALLTARIEHLQTLAAHALARAEDTKTGQVTRLKKHLLPNGIPQEREMNFLTYLLKHGQKPLEMLLALPAGFVGEVEIP